MLNKLSEQSMGSWLVGPYNTAGRVHRFWMEERPPDTKETQ